jgi:hypothetical protein
LVKILVLGVCGLDRLEKQIDAPAGASEVWGILFVSLAAGSGKKITIRTTDKVGVTGMGQNTGFRCMQARPTEKADTVMVGH